MRDDGRLLSGRKITSPPRLFLGAAENPCIPPYDWRPQRLAKKIEAGAEFIQTNYIFDISLFENFMMRVRDLGLEKKAFIIAGVGPLPSAKTARWMRSNVPGIHIPDLVIERMERSADPESEGKSIGIELIRKIHAIGGVAGVHVMAYRREHMVSEIILESGILGRRAS